MKSHEKLLLENKAWAEEIRQREPDYFERLAADQKPRFYGLVVLIAVCRQILLLMHSQEKYLHTVI